MRGQRVSGGLTHGHARRGQQTPEYRAWIDMHRRCSIATKKDYARYGERGIKVCERWQSFDNFLADIGGRPSQSHSIDRIDNDCGYEPGNCRWATPMQQAHNRATTRLISFGGTTMCIREWERSLGLGCGTLWRRLAKGMPLEQALRRRDQ